jgi:hypothetical protein
MNRRSLLAAVVFALGGAFTAQPASAQARQDFSIVNSSGFQVNKIYVSATSQNNWGRDLLGENVLPNGRVFDVTFAPNTQECSWDILIVYADGDRSEFRRANLCNIRRVTLFWDTSRNQTRFVTE